MGREVSLSINRGVWKSPTITVDLKVSWTLRGLVRDRPLCPSPLVCRKSFSLLGLL